MRRLLAFAVLVGACTLAGPVRADPHDDAGRLFREGRALYDARDYAAACERFAESERLEPAAGTQLNLADCYERIGRIATAWSVYKEALAAASLRGRRDWERFAQRRIDALAPAVPHLVIRIGSGVRAPGLVVTRDGEPVAGGDLGREVPIDPGRHVIVASAPDREPWTTSVDIARGRAYVVEITSSGVREAAKPPTPKPPAPSTTAPASDPGASSWQRPLGLVVGGVGIVAIGFGAAAGAVAIGARSDAVAACPSYPTACTPEGTSANERAVGWATASTAAFIGGVALTTVGVLFVLTAPRASSARIDVSPLGAARLSVQF